MAIASKALTLAFVLSASDKMSRVVDQAIKKSSQSLSSFERKYGQVGGNMMKFGGKLLAASTTVGGAIIGMAKSTADYGNTAAKTARSVGMDAEEFQKLSYAAKYAGVDQQKLSASMVRLNKNIVAAAGGSKAAQQTFKDLGINLKDSAGNLRAPNEILADIADVFSSTEDGAGKTALAYELLGRSGADMISLLNGGSAGLKTMGAEAERMGLVISNDAAHASEDFCDNLDRVTDSIRGVVFQMGAAMMPAINNTAIKIKEAITKVTEWLRENPKLASTIGTIGLVLTGLLAVVGLASVVFGSLIFVIGKFAGAFRAATSAIKVGQAIIMACKNSMLLFRIQYAAFVVWSKLAAVGQWLFNSALFACPITWSIA
ncbi:phage tail tape measure protein [uncultured Alistipes sp.]|uniref:phage tail tape measure protein n=1 Tax=uncultured Alistipes sp. TaxID=538949 RepID=UPI002595A02C|nr:phage tail tape measure protein [uncultured Alistipes sp.]